MHKKAITKIFFTLLVSLLLATCGKKKEQTQEKESAKKMTTADYIQQASFVTLEGDTISVANFKGKVVMINFWETSCNPCISSFPAIQKLQNRYSNNFISIMVTPGFGDTKKDVIQFKENHDYSFTYAMDTSNLYKKLKVQKLPFKIFIAPDKKNVKTLLGSAGVEQDFNKIEKIIKKYSSSL